MAYNGPEFYDDDTLFSTYQSMREKPDNANITLEQPVFMELMGSAAGLRVLDLGCGDARFGCELLQHGATQYVGMEASHRMAAAARIAVADPRGEIVETAIEAWVPPHNRFDLVVSRLVLHYVEDFDMVCTKVAAALSDDGRFIFSVEHPVVTSSVGKVERTGVYTDCLVDDYFVTGRRVKQWMGSEVIIYHRTVEDYVLGLQRAGFRLDALREGRPQAALFSDSALYARRLRIPRLLFCAVSKV